MSKTIISEGKTTNEAIEKGLKELKVSKNMVDIKVLESESKRSFFDILAPRVVKVEMTVKEEFENQKEIRNEKKEVKEERIIDANELENAKNNVERFISEFLKQSSEKNFDYKVEIIDQNIEVNILGEDSGFLIGYRGDVLNSLQTILSSIANKNNHSRIKVILDIENYRNKRKETLENLAVKVSKTVSRTGKSITLEPMGAYERKIIHTKLQDNKYVTTYSIGEEPNRKVVIARK
ncbi:MAG: Jag N-terminal domain-containing protein [Clostridia bacterium]|nr:Jag N-terminal domain-containing protein [Clostridia bacterium]